MSKAKFEVDKERLQTRITRTFKASPERMWQAFSDPAQIPHWWGIGRLAVDKHDFKVGGAWRYIDKDEQGKEHAFSGEFKEIDEPRKIIRTFIYEPWPQSVITESIEFTSLPDGNTEALMISNFDNLQSLEGMISSGMEKGATIGLDRLAKLVETA